MYKERKYTNYKPSKKISTFISHVAQQYDVARRQLERGYRHIDDMSYKQFWKFSRDMYNGYVPNISETLYTNDPVKWHSRIFRKKTRKKVIASSANLLASGIGIDISALKTDNKVDREFSKIIEQLDTWSAEREMQDGVLLRAILQAFTVGTAVVEDGIVWEEREVKEIDDIDFTTGKIISTKKKRTTFKGAKLRNVRIEEMFFGDITERDVQAQPFIIKRFTSIYDSVSSSFSKYKNWDSVIPDSKYFFGADSDTKEIEEDYDGRIEIVMYWCKASDTFAIICNGVLLTDYDMGFPNPDKNYPFSVFTPFPFADTSFIHGDSLAHINIGEQKTINDFINIMIDSEKLRNKPPVTTNSEEIARQDIVIPGAMIATRQGEEVNIMQAFSQGTSQGLLEATNIMERQIDENSIDPLVSGENSRDAMTATEVRAIMGSAEQMKGITEKLYADYLVQIANIRIPNLLWFLVNDEEYQEIVISDVIVRGSRGNRYIVLSKGAELPSPAKIARMEFERREKGENPEFIYVNKDKVNDYRFHVTVSAYPKPARNSASRLQREIQKYGLYAQNQLVDQKKNTEKLMYAMGDSPDEYITEQPQAQEQQQPGLGQDIASLLSAGKEENMPIL